MSMEKKQHSIWERDITHEMIGVLAVFGLVVSSLVTGLGVAAVGVQAQVAFAQHVGGASQTAAAILGANLSAPAASSTVGTSTQPMRPTVASSTAMFCPKIAKTVGFGGKDATSTGDITQLQMFIASHYGLPASTTVSGYFGSTTAGLVQKFQQEQGIAPSPTVGPLTRAAIAKLCGSGQAGGDQKPPQTPPMGTSTPPIRSDMKPPQTGSTTAPMPATAPVQHTDTSVTPTHGDTPTTPPTGSTVSPPPTAQPPVTRHPEAPTTTRPVTMGEYEGSSNAAAVVSAINEIGAGYNKLLDALLSLAGL